MDEELFEDAPEALNEDNSKRYFPIPYQEFYQSVKYIPDSNEVKTPAGINSPSYDRY